MSLKRRSLLPPKPAFLSILSLSLCNKEEGHWKAAESRKNTVSLRSAGRRTISHQGYCSLFSWYKMSGVGTQGLSTEPKHNWQLQLVASTSPGSFCWVTRSCLSLSAACCLFFILRASSKRMLCSTRDAVWNSGWLLPLGSPRRLLWVVCEPQILCHYLWFLLLFGCLQLAFLDVKSADFTESSCLFAFSLYLHLNIYFLTFACSILNKLTYSKPYHRAFSEPYRVCLWLLRLSVSIGNATGCVLLEGLHIKMSTFECFVNRVKYSQKC